MTCGWICTEEEVEMSSVESVEVVVAVGVFVVVVVKLLHE